MLDTKGKKISYKTYSSKSQKKMPTIVFLGGFMSDKNSTKATFLFEFCQKNELNYICFDYTGHGESSGTMSEGTISSWLEDSLDVIDNLTKGEVLLIGSSMGGWLALLVAIARPERIKALIGIASSPDFTENLVWKKLTHDQQKELMDKGVIEIFGRDKGEYKYIFTKNLIMDGRKNCLMNNSIPIKKPVILLHGYQDKTVHVDVSLKLAELIESEDVSLLLSKNSNHKMANEQDLKMLEFAIYSLISQ
jgi:pimeloyl-ACP methyl ester carboxylesterase